MHKHGSTKDVIKAEKKLVLVGNPNVGKSVTFGILTGKYVIVSNYPGTTVEISRGTATFEKSTMIIDTPGINNLIPMSEDERVTRDILLDEDVDYTIQVIDSKNLRRGLIITTQLAEMGIPFILNLNMEDEALARGITIDKKRLAEIFGVEVISTIATQKKNTGKLISSLENCRKSSFSFEYDPHMEEAIHTIQDILPKSTLEKRSMALMVLSGDESLNPWLHQRLKEENIEKIEKVRQDLEEIYGESIHYVINSQRLGVVDSIVEEVVNKKEVRDLSVARKLGELSMHPFWGIPILAVVLLLLFKFVGEFGAGTLVDFFEGKVFGEYVNPWSESLVRGFIPIPFIQDLLVGEYGIITMALTYSVAIVFPIVGVFFIAFGMLEDSGYLPRLSIMVNKVFRKMGLNGKAVLPMILGLGCDTMATLTARIMETKKERIIVTLLLALAIPCSAQLGVILGILAGFDTIIPALIWTGTLVMVIILVGYLSSKIIPGGESAFVMELPPIRVPQLENILIKTLARIEWYLREAVPLFILGTLVLFTLDKLNLLGVIRELAAPVVVHWLDLPVEATDAFLIGFLRRDYGAAGLYVLWTNGMMDGIQAIVSLVTITLFVPCIANTFIIIKERGIKVAMAMIAFIFPFAFLVGGVLNIILRALGVSF